MIIREPVTEVIFYVFDWHEGGFVGIQLNRSIVLVAATMEMMEEEAKREIGRLLPNKSRVEIRLRRFMTYNTRDYLVVLQKRDNYGRTRTA